MSVEILEHLSGYPPGCRTAQYHVSMIKQDNRRLEQRAAAWVLYDTAPRSAKSWGLRWRC